MRRHGLGRRPAKDERDQRFLLPPATIARPKKKTWTLRWKGNQQATSECVGYAWHGLLRALPHLQRDPKPTAIYLAAQKVDEWPGEDYDGTSVRAGAKVLQASGQVTAYGWAFTLTPMLDWLGTQGPVVLGTNWYEKMMTPTAEGLIKIGGRIVGGHAWVAIGYNDAEGLLYCQNSWSKAWGKNGRFYISYADLERLLTEEGEACTPTEIGPNMHL